MKLLIGVPTAGNPAAPFVQSLQAIVLPPEVVSIEQKTTTGNFVPAQRELLAAFALHRAADFLMMVDDDMVVPPDVIAKLLAPMADPRVGIVGALCYSRDGLRPMAVDAWESGDTTTAAIPAFDDRTPVEVDGVGFGLALVRCAALAQLTEPYFPVQVFIEQRTARVRICNEDFLFCKRLREAGWKVMLHPGARCGHYDRASGQTFPLEWEAPEVSNVRRMLVRAADGSIVKAPYDAATIRAGETHIKADLEYIIVD